jgi:hypothetical protein
MYPVIHHNHNLDHTRPLDFQARSVSSQHVPGPRPRPRPPVRRRGCHTNGSVSLATFCGIGLQWPLQKFFAHKRRAAPAKRISPHPSHLNHEQNKQNEHADRCERACACLCRSCCVLAEERQQQWLDRAEIRRHQRGEVPGQHCGGNCTVYLASPCVLRQPPKAILTNNLGQREFDEQQDCRCLFCEEYGQKGRGNYQQVSHEFFDRCAECRASVLTTRPSQFRLLEVFSILEQVNTIKDPQSVHHETLVQEYERLVLVICEDHVNAAKQHIEDPNIQASLVAAIEAECKEILDYREAAERWHLEIDSRSKDRIVSFGEKLSCRFMAMLLQDRVRSQNPSTSGTLLIMIVFSSGC